MVCGGQIFCKKKKHYLNFSFLLTKDTHQYKYQPINPLYALCFENYVQ